jgi:hypothetical protein
VGEGEEQSTEGLKQGFLKKGALKRAGEQTRVETFFLQRASRGGKLGFLKLRGAREEGREESRKQSLVYFSQQSCEK